MMSTNRGGESNKRFFYVPLHEEYFSNPSLRRLERKHHAEGVLTFLKLSTFSIKNDGILKRHNESLGESFAEELAFNIEVDDSALVENTIKYSVSLGLMIENPDSSITIPWISDHIKSYGQSAVRMANKRKRDKKALEDADGSDGKAEEDSQSDGLASQSDGKINQNQNQRESKSESKEEKTVFSGMHNEDMLGVEHVDESGTIQPIELTYEELRMLNEYDSVRLNDTGMTKYMAETENGTKRKGKSILNPLRALRTWKNERVRSGAYSEYFECKTGKINDDYTDDSWNSDQTTHDLRQNAADGYSFKEYDWEEIEADDNIQKARGRNPWNDVKFLTVKEMEQADAERTQFDNRIWEMAKERETTPNP